MIVYEIRITQYADTTQDHADAEYCSNIITQCTQTFEQLLHTASYSTFESSFQLLPRTTWVIDYSKENLKIHRGSPFLPPLPSPPLLPVPLPSLPLPFPSLPISPSLRSRPP